jgi:AcrR family transcriptional regulator
MKTADRILEASLDMFNSDGERNVTASDVAVALDISPGNLYYHFKGKDEILEALWSRHYRALAGALSAPIHDPGVFGEDELDMERVWLYLTVVLEQMYEHRFVYHNLDDLMLRFESVRRGVPRLVTMMRAACTTLAVSLLRRSHSDDASKRVDRIANAMALTLTYWLSFDRMQRPSGDELTTIHSGVLQVLSVCAPFLGGEEAGFYEQCEAIYAHMLTSSDLKTD